MFPRFFLLAALFLFAFSGEEGNKYPTDYFQWPIKHPVRVSGTFGELRPNHFHAGIDLKASNGAVGDPLYAAGPGHISRIKIQSGGYGQALYIDHPNGYTTVYAHMLAFTPEVEAYVKEQQYQRQSFEVDLYLEKGLFSFEKGAYIGKLGTSGRSFGPHLHFEIRHTQSEKPLNPLLFGLKMVDKRQPSLRQLKVYELDEENRFSASKVHSLYPNGRSYRIGRDTLIVNSNKVGLAMKAYDLHDYVNNLNGIYALEMYVDDTLHFQFDFEGFSFDETRYINCHMDYRDRLRKKSYFNRCFKMPGNQLKIYDGALGEGWIDLEANVARKIRFEVTDVPGNVAIAEGWIKWNGNTPTPKKTPHDYHLFYDQPNVILTEDSRLEFPTGSFYEDLLMTYRFSDDQSADFYSRVHHLHFYDTPVHKYFDIELAPNKPIPDSLRDQAFIAYCDANGRVTNCGGEWEDGKLKAKARELGDYAIMLDPKAPKITPLNVKENMRSRSRIRFRIQDNFAAARNVVGLTFNATIDGEWVLMQFDSKNSLLFHEFEKSLPAGKHDFHLELFDAVGNRSTFDHQFVR